MPQVTVCCGWWRSRATSETRADASDVAADRQTGCEQWCTVELPKGHVSGEMAQMALGSGRTVGCTWVGGITATQGVALPAGVTAFGASALYAASAPVGAH